MVQRSETKMLAHGPFLNMLRGTADLAQWLL